MYPRTPNFKVEGSFGKLLGLDFELNIAFRGQGGIWCGPGKLKLISGRVERPHWKTQHSWHACKPPCGMKRAAVQNLHRKLGGLHKLSNYTQKRGRLTRLTRPLKEIEIIKISYRATVSRVSRPRFCGYL